MTNRLVLPEIGPISSVPMTVDQNKRMVDQDFKFHSRVQDNDSITNPGVTSCLIWVIIILKDEHKLFKNFPATKDLADMELLKATQRSTVVNA